MTAVDKTTTVEEFEKVLKEMKREARRLEKSRKGSISVWLHMYTGDLLSASIVKEEWVRPIERMTQDEIELWYKLYGDEYLEYLNDEKLTLTTIYKVVLKGEDAKEGIRVLEKYGKERYHRVYYFH